MPAGAIVQPNTVTPCHTTKSSLRISLSRSNFSALYSIQFFGVMNQLARFLRLFFSSRSLGALKKGERARARKRAREGEQVRERERERESGRERGSSSSNSGSGSGSGTTRLWWVRKTNCQWEGRCWAECSLSPLLRRGEEHRASGVYWGPPQIPIPSSAPHCTPGLLSTTAPYVSLFLSSPV